MYRVDLAGLATPCQSAALLWRANFTPLARVGAPIMKDCKVGERLAFFLSLFIGSELSYHIASKHPAPTLPIISQDSSTCLLFFLLSLLANCLHVTNGSVLFDKEMDNYSATNNTQETTPASTATVVRA